jgi:hypothetical protein
MKTMTMNLEVQMTPYAYWGYERAFACDYISEIIPGIGCADTDEKKEEVHKMHREVCELFGVHLDNKQTFAVRAVCSRGGAWEDVKPIYLTFHDGRLFVGLGVRPYRGGELPKPDKEFSL